MGDKRHSAHKLTRKLIITLTYNLLQKILIRHPGRRKLRAPLEAEGARRSAAANRDTCTSELCRMYILTPASSDGLYLGVLQSRILGSSQKPQEGVREERNVTAMYGDVLILDLRRTT